MTFFNKKTEVMQIEMTPYGRYLYSIGKFKPHSYEFVDDDVLYKNLNSSETQEAAHSRILEETPKPKINRAFQDEAPEAVSPPTISEKRVMTKKMNQRQSNLYSLGRSAYSGSNIPLMQMTMLQGEITGSEMNYTVSTISHGQGGEVLIPQIEVDLNFRAALRDSLDPLDEYDGESVQSVTFDDGTYIDIRYIEPIIHLKEFNSFYEKENFEIEVFKVTGDIGDQTLAPLKIEKKFSAIVNGLLVESGPLGDFIPAIDALYEEDGPTPEFVDYFFEIQADSEIPTEELCKAVDSLEINNQFLDEELICPDQRNDRFDIYSTRVSPEDLEDCN